MKTAIGMMACIAIAFCWITSPESSKSHASKDTTPALQSSVIADLNSLDGKLDNLLAQVENSKQELLKETESFYDDRIDKLEKQLAELDQKIIASATGRSTTPPSSEPAKSATINSTTKPTAATTIVSSSIKPATVVSPAVSSKAADGTRSVPATYSARWQNYDGLSPREHAEVMHGINTAGLTDAQIAMMRDRDHDIYGSGHPEAMRAANRSSTVASRSPSSFASSVTSVSYSPPPAAQPRSVPPKASYNAVPATSYKPQQQVSRPRLFSRWRSCPNGNCP